MEVDFKKTVFFDFQKPSKIKGFRLRTQETANRILSLSSLPIPSHRRLNTVSIPQKIVICKTLPGIFLTFFKLCEIYIAKLHSV